MCMFYQNKKNFLVDSSNLFLFFSLYFLFLTVQNKGNERKIKQANGASCTSTVPMPRRRSRVYHCVNGVIQCLWKKRWILLLACKQLSQRWSSHNSHSILPHSDDDDDDDDDDTDMDEDENENENENEELLEARRNWGRIRISKWGRTSLIHPSRSIVSFRHLCTFGNS